MADMASAIFYARAEGLVMTGDFNGCLAALAPAARNIFDNLLTSADSNRQISSLRFEVEQGRFPPFLPDLFRAELAVARVKASGQPTVGSIAHLTINPTLELLPVSWANLEQKLTDPAAPIQSAPGTFIMIWRPPGSADVQIRQADVAHLLALKILAEGLRPEAVAAQEGISIGALDAALQQAMEEGLILRPPSTILRPQSFAPGSEVDPQFLRAKVFTLQWHITQACDLHCRHCYDRTKRGDLPLAKAMSILDKFRGFCRDRFVHGQVTFTGGNPLLYPHFRELYQGAVARYLGVAILGNPAPRHQIEELISIAKPLFYQVSLEGLAEHNDFIRGPGHFARVLDFLALLKELGVYSMVMLTLTRANQEQVLPLAEILRDKVDLFTFTRLAAVGEGAKLQGPEIESYPRFLQKFHEAAQHNPCLGFKDNLFNLQASAEGREPFGGCTGHGCGAAFNFIALLADGEVHACRKFPSPIGNAFSERLATVYDSERAEAYRQGCAACQGCRIRPVCGGCQAVAHGLGLDPLQTRDPYCWLKRDEHPPPTLSCE